MGIKAGQFHLLLQTFFGSRIFCELENQLKMKYKNIFALLLLIALLENCGARHLGYINGVPDYDTREILMVRKEEMATLVCDCNNADNPENKRHTYTFYNGLYNP